MRKSMVVWSAATLLALGFTACKSVNVIGYPVEFIDIHAPEHVWVTQPDKSVTELYAPQLKGDTLVGFVKGTGAYVEIPVANIQIMKAPQVSAMKTALFAGTVAIGGALLLAQVTGSAPYCANFAPGAANNGLVQPCGTTNGKPNTDVATSP
jgi:hypothetical protein